ncbi:MAG: hypothetical protein OXI32_01890 [bacterium]|nr:hypothetical protein [bacterium]
MKALFPYETLFGDVTLEVAEVRIDDEIVADQIEVDSCTVDLRHIERADWKSAEISVVAHAPPAEIIVARDVMCVAVVNCTSTNHRIFLTLTPNSNSPGHWEGNISIEREFWYSHAQLRACVTATVDSISHRLIGTSETWTLRYDDLPYRPVNGAIKVTWVDFSEPEEKQYLRHHRENYMYLSLDPEEPQLFLNRTFEGLEQLLADRGRRGHDRALHDQTRASIADKTWSALFNAAINAVEADEETGVLDWPPIEWQCSVLKALLARMYPDKSADDALREAWLARMSPELPGMLQEHLSPAAAMQARAPRLLRESIWTIAHDLDSSEQTQ